MNVLLVQSIVKIWDNIQWGPINQDGGSTTTTISLESVVQQATLGYVTTPSFLVYDSISKSLQPT